MTTPKEILSALYHGSGKLDAEQWLAYAREAESHDARMAQFLRQVCFLVGDSKPVDERFEDYPFGGVFRFNATTNNIASRVQPDLVYESWMPGFMTGMNSLVPNDCRQDTHGFPIRLEIDVHGRSANLSKRKCAAVVTCDQRYFFAFADTFSMSFREFEPGRPIVMGIVIREGESIESRTLHRFVENNPNVLIRVYRTSATDRSIFANARFVIVKDLLKEGMDNVISVDIDCRFKGGLSPLFRGMKNVTDAIGLKVQKPIRLPWYYTMAGFIYWPRTTEALDVLEDMLSRLTYLYSRSYALQGGLWYSDQTTLLQSLITTNARFIRIGNMHFKDIWEQVGATGKGVEAARHALGSD